MGGRARSRSRATTIPATLSRIQGAATGVGGILRDIFTMNARPLAVMDSLRFGPLDETEPDAALRRRNHAVVNGVVARDCELWELLWRAEPGGRDEASRRATAGNPLVNAFALGLVRKDEIFYAKATGVGNPVIYVGAKTGRDGIHGATMASEEFTEDSEAKRPNVQMGDPFMEKLLLEACLEAMATGAVVGIQDMGAAGLTCSTCEMGARGELGLTIELDLVPQRATGMTAYEIMLSESQERMLLVADKGREGEVLAVFAKWGLDASIVGVVTADDTMRVTHHGELVAEIPNKALTDEAPVYHRPVGEWKAPVPKDPPAWVVEELKKPRDYTADLKKLLASANICDKRWVYEQYDSMVQSNTVQGPGGEAGVMRIKQGSGVRDQGTEKTPERGLAMALAGNGRWCWLDPKLGAMHAVAEAARKVACTGAVPVAATNCLNFGNPEKPEIMAQFSATIDGIAEACTALGTPITGGNVSFYNETKGEGIYPTPVVGVVGILEDVSKAVPAAFQKVGDTVLFLSAFRGKGRKAERDLGAGAFAQSVGWPLWGGPVVLDLAEEFALHQALAALAKRGLLNSAADISDGGFITTTAKAAIAGGLGAEIATGTIKSEPYYFTEVLFAEIGSSVIASCAPENLDEIRGVLKEFAGTYVAPLGTVTGRSLRVSINGDAAIDAPLADLKQHFSSTLESQLAAEVVTA